MQRNHTSLSLHAFLRNEHDAILHAWERLNRRRVKSARELSDDALRDNMPAVLRGIAAQAQKQDLDKVFESPKEGPRRHAEQRWTLGFSLQELTREYGLLRSAILQRLVPRVGELGVGELVFLNEALDEAIVESVASYVASWNRKMDNERERLQVTLSGISDGVVSTDTEGRVTYMNPAATDITGWPCQEALGRAIDQVVVVVEEADGQALKSLTRTAAESGGMSRHSCDALMRRRDGELVPVEETATPLRDSSGNLMGVVTTFHDVSKIRETTSQLGYLAAHDALTGLPNRSLLRDRLSQEMAHAQRHGERLALLYLDLDLFKNVNDSLGHAAGDDLLKQVARRLIGCVRRTDTVSRLGGDEFVVLLTEFDHLTSLGELGAEIAKQLSSPYDLGGVTVDISTSIGIAFFPEDGADESTLMKHADMAMYHAKLQGRNNVQFFAPQMNRRANERRELQGDLRKAVDQRQLKLHFQPQVNLSTGQVIGAEALLRWRHPRHGRIGPDRFIPVAEESRQVMIALGDWVLERVCRQARLWLDAGYAPLRLSVNVSMVQLQHETFLPTLRKLLQRYRLPADLLQFEVTESVLMSEMDGGLERIRALANLGVRIAVDNFGTGCSSLRYLKGLPVNELKIDRSFIQQVGSDTSTAAIVQAMIRMAQSLRLRVVAEGVEDQTAASFLNANGCEAVQGYYYGRPTSAAMFERHFLYPIQ